MKNQELFDRTVGILVKAYQSGTLAHGEPCGCAIGNMIAANNGYRIDTSDQNGFKWDNGKRIEDFSCWNHVQAFGKQYRKEDSEEYITGAIELLSTGYSIDDTCKIEYAFERTHIGEDLDGFKGLMCVVDCLMTIHEANTEEITAAKSLFKKELAEVG